ncbi:MAG: molybdopterin-binding protein [Helicobacteraceae bacterium]
MNFYTVIIGDEILNSRVADAHFEFVSRALKEKNLKHKAAFFVGDNLRDIENIFKLIVMDKKSVLFSFGGIGPTADDLTRQGACVFTQGGGLSRHKKALELIKQSLRSRLDEKTAAQYLKNGAGLMAQLPKGAKLIENPYNSIPGFRIKKRFFFFPGFSSMAHPMLTNTLNEFFKPQDPLAQRTFLVFASEGELIRLIEKPAKHLELSCLATLDFKTTLRLRSKDKAALQKWSGYIQKGLEKRGINFETRDGF